MALLFNGSSNCLTTTSWTPATQPMTFSCWIKFNDTAATQSLISIGDKDTDLGFNSLEYKGNGDAYEMTAMSFVSYAEADSASMTDTTNYHHMVGVFSSSTLTIYVDNVATSAAWTPGTNAFDLLAIGRTVSSAYTEFANGYIEHVAIWNTALTASDVLSLYNQTIPPNRLKSSYCVSYLPLTGSVNDLIGTFTWNSSAFSTFTYQTSGISYPSTITRTINHKNYDADRFTNTEISNASSLKVYFEHASTGQDIVGNSNTDSSTGLNNDGSLTCGIALLYAINNRYLCYRSSYSSSNDYTWYSTHTGLQDDNRGNPTPAEKVSGFLGMSSNMRSATKVAMFKFCWIDVWPSVSGYVSDGAAFAASMISDITTFESNNPSLIVPYWTMPLQSNESYAAREAFNSAIRTHCTNNNKWLLDMADIECHTSLNVKQTDGNSREIAYSDYVTSDGGHLSNAGSTKMARAYWTLLASIANESASSISIGWIRA